MPLDQLETVIASHIMKSYECLAVKEKELQALPNSLKEHYIQLNSKFDVSNILNKGLDDVEFVKKRDSVAKEIEELK